ncbi:hypothetical protein R1flu_011721 [Riccia fluitans]|uniref:Uncharacterized protein n=1 Tax=Riccia fluitans TaxID=41844 RepID=A0ABD1ZB53_9MARC
MEDNLFLYVDDDLDDDFLSWKPSSSVLCDKGAKAKDVPEAKPKSKPFSKLDFDFDFDSSFQMPSFDLDLDFNSSPPKKKTPTQKNIEVIDDIDISIDLKRFNSSPPKKKTLTQKNLEGIDDISDDLEGFKSSPPRRTLAQKNEGIDDISVDIRGCSNSGVDVSKKSKLNSTASSSKSVKEKLPNKVSEQVSKTTDTKFVEFELPSSAGEDCSPAENVPVTSKASKQNIETDEEMFRPLSEKAPGLSRASNEDIEIEEESFHPHVELPVSRTQVNPKPVIKNVSSHFRKSAPEESTGTRNELSLQKSEGKSSSEAQEFSLPAEDHLKLNQGAEETANEVLQSASFHHQQSEDPHLSESLSRKTAAKGPFTLSGGLGAIKPQQLATRDSTQQESSPVLGKELQQAPTDADFDNHLMPAEEEESAEGDKKATEDTHVDDTNILQTWRPQHTDEELIAYSCRFDTVAPFSNGEETASQDEAFAGPVEYGFTSTLPGGAAFEHFEKIKTLQISTQATTSGEAAAKDHLPRKEHLTEKTSIDGSLPRRERSRSPIILGLNSLPRKSRGKELGVGQDLGGGSRYIPVQTLGSTQVQSLQVPRKIIPPEGPAGHHDECERTRTGKRKLATEHKKEKKQVRFQMEMPRLELQLQNAAKLTPRDYGKKQTLSVIKKLDLVSTGFTSLPSSRTKESTAVKADGFKTGFLSQRKKDASDIPSKRHGLAELEKSKNSQMNRSTNQNKFSFERVQVGKAASERTSTKYTPIQLTSKTTAEPEDLHAASTSLHKYQGNPTVHAPLQYSSKTTGEQVLSKTSGSLPDENQEALERLELPKDLLNTGSSSVKNPTSADSLTNERKGIMEQANVYSDKLHVMMKNLKRLNGDAKDLVVRALICNNKLLMMQAPRKEEKISSVTFHQICNMREWKRITISRVK